VHHFEKLRKLLNFIDDDVLCLRVCLEHLDQVFRRCQVAPEDCGIEEVYSQGIWKFVGAFAVRTSYPWPAKLRPFRSFFGAEWRLHRHFCKPLNLSLGLAKSASRSSAAYRSVAEPPTSARAVPRAIPQVADARGSTFTRSERGRHLPAALTDPQRNQLTIGMPKGRCYQPDVFAWIGRTSVVSVEWCRLPPVTAAALGCRRLRSTPPSNRWYAGVGYYDIIPNPPLATPLNANGNFWGTTHGAGRRNYPDFSSGAHTTGFALVAEPCDSILNVAPLR